MWVCDVVKFSFILMILWTPLLLAAENRRYTGHDELSSTIPRSARRQIKDNEIGVSGILRWVPDEEGNRSLALIPNSQERYYLDFGSDPELRAHLESLVTRDSSDGSVKIVDLIGVRGRKNGKSLQVFAVGDTEESNAKFLGKYNISLSREGLSRKKMDEFVTQLKETFPDVQIGMVINNGEPHGAMRYMSIQILSDYSRAYLSQRMVQSEGLKRFAQSIDKTVEREPHR